MRFDPRGGFRLRQANDTRNTIKRARYVQYYNQNPLRSTGSIPRNGPAVGLITLLLITTSLRFMPATRRSSTVLPDKMEL
jgi:hypothetical protein